MFGVFILPVGKKKACLASLGNCAFSQLAYIYISKGEGSVKIFLSVAFYVLEMIECRGGNGNSSLHYGSVDFCVQTNSRNILKMQLKSVYRVLSVNKNIWIFFANHIRHFKIIRV